MIVRFQPQRLDGMGDLDPSAILPPSRDELSNETDLLLGHIQQLGRDFFNSDDNSVDATTLSSWNTFVSQVTSWDSGPRILSHVISTTWRDELIGYQQQFNGFVSAFAGAGVATTVAPFTFNAPPSTASKVVDALGNAASKATKPLTSAISTIETVAIVGGLVGVGFLFYLTWETGRTARHVGAELLR